MGGMALSETEAAAVARLSRQILRRRGECHRLSSYYEGVQRLEHLGLAVPPELRRFETVLNVPRMAVDEVERRMDVRAFHLPGETSPSDVLMDLWDGNDMAEKAPLAFKDALIYGRGFLTVAGDPDAPGSPVIAVEHAPDFAVESDPRTGRVLVAMREYRDEWGNRQAATLYTPGEVVWMGRQRGVWVEEGRARHSWGRVPVVVLVNRPRTGEAGRYGTSEMADVIGLTDSIARTITNLQVAAEANAIPQKYIVGAAPQGFVNKDGKPIPVWESYFTSVWAVTNKEAKMGTFTAASLNNFHDTVNHMFAWAASMLGLPLRYAAQNTAQPATEGSIRADEARLIKNCERKMTVWGNALGILMGMAYEAQTGEAVDAARVSTRWFDAGTPTYAQRADATQKLAGGTPILSREGAWEEMGWSPERMETERQRFLAEDTTLSLLTAKADGVA